MIRGRVRKRNGRWDLLIPVPGGFVVGAYPTWREAFDTASREVAFQRHLDEVLP